MPGWASGRTLSATIGRSSNQAGFEVVRYDQIPNWAKHVAAGFGAVLQQRKMLEAELGEAAAAALLMEAAITTEIRPYCGHVLAVATRT